MKLHKESKGTIFSCYHCSSCIRFLAVYFLEIWSLIILIPLLILYGLVFGSSEFQNRDIVDHKENVIAPVDGKVVMIKEVFEDEFLKRKKPFKFLFLCLHECSYL